MSILFAKAKRSAYARELLRVLNVFLKRRYNGDEKGEATTRCSFSAKFMIVFLTFRSENRSLISNFGSCYRAGILLFITGTR